MGNTIFKMFTDLSLDFDEKYKQDKNFLQRWAVWSIMISKYMKPGDTVYDLGCGPGIFSFYAALNEANVTGMDGSPGMIKLCNEKGTRLPAELSNKIQFVQDVLPLADPGIYPKADLIICSSVFEYIKERDKMMLNFQALLKDNGVLLISVPNRRSVYRFFENISYRITGKPAYLKHVVNQFTESELTELFGKHNFEPLEKKYYASSYLFSWFLKPVVPEEFYSNLLLVAFQLRKK